MDMARVKQWEVWLAGFDPTQGAEINKTRPAVILSNNLTNKNLQTVILAPLTSIARKYPSRAPTDFNGNGGQIALDQLRCMDKSRLKKKIGEIPQDERQDISDILELIFRSV